MPMIRQATSDDLEALTNLRVAFFEDLGEITGEKQAQAFWEATYRYLSEALPRGTFLAWVAEEEGQIVGTSGLIFFEQAPTPTNLVGNEGYVLNMYTVPPWRGQGIAKTLIAEGLKFLWERGHPQAWLEVYAHNESAISLYKLFGFETFKEEISLGYLLT